MAGISGVVKELAGQTGLYKKSLIFFLFLAVAVAAVYWALHSHLLNAETPLSGPADNNAVIFTLGGNGNVYLGNTRQSVEVFKTDATYRYRFQILNNPTESIDQLVVQVKLPKPATDSTVTHRLINNGGAATAVSELTDPQTITFTATSISPQAQLAIEFEVPQSFVTQTALERVRESLGNASLTIWTIVSIAVPVIAGLLLLLVSIGRIRRVSPSPQQYQDAPDRLPPALLGILLRGRLTTRELAATLVDLARRGHLVIHQVTPTDFRFRRTPSNDQLADFERVLLEQIFGATAETASGEEINFVIAQELFSKKVSQAFILAYHTMNELGYFYTNPLTLHRRYQTASIVLFFLAAAGLALSAFLFSDIPLLLLFWGAMALSAILINLFSRGLPVRTTYGDRELGRWLSFRQTLTNKASINYAALSQEKYLAYLPYAIIFESEVAWTKRFIELPFIQPAWYAAANISTIEDFTNRIFPLFGYLAHALSLSAQPGAR